MNKKILASIFVITLLACNNGQDKKAEVADSINAEVNTGTVKNAIEIPGKQCFERILKQDTIAIELFIRDTSASGNLIYNLYEKDRNKGSFKGSIHNDIILADYTFASEGKNSVRQVIFKLKDGVLTEGYGETLLKDDKFIFKDTSKIQYTQVFEPVNCK
jgi:hypothetical protein